MLYLISIGLYDEKDVSLKALEAAKKCDTLYVEFYTTKLDTTAKKLSKLIKKPVKELTRADLEEKSNFILTQAREKKVGILVGGDALTATTHISLLLEAKKMGIHTKVIHGSSIYSAVAETGLQPYKFGASATIAKPQKNYKPTSFYDVISDNKKLGLHTLLFLDKDLDTRQGLKILSDIEKIKKKKVILPRTKLIIASKLGSEKEKMIYGEVQDLLKKKLQSPAVILIPGKLHFIEKEFLESLK